jgi:predicted nucleic acid-binding protein
LRTAVDTNIFAGLLSGRDEAVERMQTALEEAHAKGTLAASPAVYAELVAGRTPETVDAFFSEKGIEVDWRLGKEVWREAGIRYAEYARTRVRQPGVSEPRRILADFLIGSHAPTMADTLLTADAGIFSTYFPEIEIVSPAG